MRRYLVSCVLRGFGELQKEDIFGRAHLKTVILAFLVLGNGFESNFSLTNVRDSAVLSGKKDVVNNFI